MGLETGVPAGVAEDFDITSVIPVGHANAVSRKYLSSVTGLEDRKLRREIEKSPAMIVNLGYGYFVPDLNDEVDRLEANTYAAQERARIHTLQEKMELKFAALEQEIGEPEQEEELVAE